MKRIISLLLLCAMFATAIPFTVTAAAAASLTVVDDVTGSTLYSGETWADAVAQANASSNNVTIRIADGYVITNSTRIKNTKGATVTVDGNGGTVTKNSHNGFNVESPNVVFKNMNIKTGNPGTGSTFQLHAACTLTLENVNVELTDAIQYCLLNTLASGTFNINMKNVNVVKTGNTHTIGIVRTGNDGDTNTVNFTAEDCVFDFRNGHGNAITATANTTSNVVFKNTTVFANNSDIVQNGGKTMTVTTTGGNFVRMGTELGADIFETIKPTYLCDVTVGSTKYTDWSQAVQAINATNGDVTVTLNSGVVLPNYKGGDGTADAIAGSNNRTVTIDGQGKTYSKPGKDVITLRLKNILHNNGGEMNINATAFVIFGEVTKTSQQQTTTMKQTLQMVNSAWETYSETQQVAVKTLCDQYPVTKTWDLNNIYPAA